MIYKDLHELIRDSRGSREYFLALPVETQIALHEQGKTIHSPEQLHRLAHSLQDHDHHTALNSGEL